MIAIASVFLLRSVAAQKDLVIYDAAQALIITEKLKAAVEKEITLFRGYVIYRTSIFTRELPAVEAQIATQFTQLQMLPLRPEELRLLTQARFDNTDYNFKARELVNKLDHSGQLERIMPDLVNELRPLRTQVELAIDTFAAIQEKNLKNAKLASINATAESFKLVGIITLVDLVLALALAFTLTRALSKLYHQALQSTRLREDVLGVVAHDLRNPLAAIRMNAELLEKLLLNPTSTPKALTIIKNIGNMAVRMNRLIQDLLDFEKIETGFLSLELKPENLESVVSEVKQMMSPLALTHQITLNTHLSGAHETLVCDRDRLLQALSNLVGNALKFTPAGGSVSLGTKVSENGVEIWVDDTGPGLSAEQIGHIFERHWQAPETAKKGNGLGLAIVKGIIEAHHGYIRVESSPGSGAKFIMTLPRNTLNGYTASFRPAHEKGATTGVPLMLR